MDSSFTHQIRQLIYIVAQNNIIHRMEYYGKEDRINNLFKWFRAVGF